MQPLSRLCCCLQVHDRDWLIRELVGRRLNAITFSAVLLLAAKDRDGLIRELVGRRLNGNRRLCGQGEASLTAVPPLPPNSVAFVACNHKTASPVHTSHQHIVLLHSTAVWLWLSPDEARPPSLSSLPT